MESDLRSLGYLWHSNYTKAWDNMIINGVGEKISPSLLLLLFPIRGQPRRTCQKETSISQQITQLSTTICTCQEMFKDKERWLITWLEIRIRSAELTAEFTRIRTSHSNCFWNLLHRKFRLLADSIALFHLFEPLARKHMYMQKKKGSESPNTAVDISIYKEMTDNG